MRQVPSLTDPSDVSFAAADDVSDRSADDVSSRASTDPSVRSAADVCSWCRGALPTDARADSVFCSQRCRQAAWRVRRRHLVQTRNARPMVMAYADPPYPGKAFLYRDQPDFGGEVDHPALVASLLASYDGFALSTSSAALGDVLPLFTRPYRVCAWVKPIGASAITNGIHNTWEPLIVVPGRCLAPGKRDWLSAQPARKGGSDLIGRKPEAFACWLFGLLGLLPGDQLVDLFPGSGMIGRAWAEVCRSGRSATKRQA